MSRLLQIELLKLRNYRAFWILIALYFVSLAGSLIGFQPFLNKFFADELPPRMENLFRWDINSFPDVWHYLTFLAGLFDFILLTIVIFLVTSEFSYKTVRQNVINGMSRMEFFAGKMLLILVMSLACTVVVTLVILFLGLTHSTSGQMGHILDKISFGAGYFLQTFGYLTVAFFVGVMVKRSGIAIGIMMIYAFFIENIAVGLIESDNIDRFFPLNSMDRMIPFPFIDAMDGVMQSGPELIDVLVSVAYTALFAGLTAWHLKAKDI